jgi:hypothetical protein
MSHSALSKLSNKLSNACADQRPNRGLDPPFEPELDYVDQAYGFRFTDGGEILLICSHDVDGITPYWNRHRPSGNR